MRKKENKINFRKLRKFLRENSVIFIPKYEAEIKLAVDEIIDSIREGIEDEDFEFQIDGEIIRAKEKFWEKLTKLGFIKFLELEEPILGPEVFKILKEGFREAGIELLREGMAEDYQEMEEDEDEDSIVWITIHLGFKIRGSKPR